MLSRNTFIPPLTVEELNTYTFNVVPAADPIPMFDDLARLYQNIDCTAEKHDLFGCHHISRSICEIQYTCGSASRPVLCECVMDYGYPDPLLEQQSEQEEATGNQSETEPPSFVEACLDLCYTGKCAFVLFCCVLWCVQYEVLAIWLLNLNLVRLIDCLCNPHLLTYVTIISFSSS